MGAGPPRMRRSVACASVDLIRRRLPAVDGEILPRDVAPALAREGWRAPPGQQGREPAQRDPERHSRGSCDRSMSPGLHVDQHLRRWSPREIVLTVIPAGLLERHAAGGLITSRRGGRRTGPTCSDRRSTPEDDAAGDSCGDARLGQEDRPGCSRRACGQSSAVSSRNGPRQRAGGAGSTSRRPWRSRPRRRGSALDLGDRGCADAASRALDRRFERAPADRRRRRAPAPTNASAH